MNNIGRVIVIFFLIAIIILIGTFFWQKNIGNNVATKYRTAKVYRGDIAQTVAANGTLNPVTLVNVGTQVTGKVQKIYADFNDHVAIGQVLLELDSALLENYVLQSLAAVNKASAEYELALANEKRGARLYRRNFLSKQDWDQLVQMRKSAGAALKLAQAQSNKDRINLDYATIRSPVSGVIIDRQVDVGQTVTANFQTPILFKIAQDLSKMQIDSSFAEADIGAIRSGQKALFTVDAFPERNFIGQVKQIRLATTVQQNVVTYNVVVLVDNQDGVLLPGMTAYVSIKTAEHKNVLLVPNAALRFKPKSDGKKGNKNSSIQQGSNTIGTVYRLVDDIIEPVTCNLGITDNHYTEVTSSKLKIGDVLVVGHVEDNKEDSSSSSLRLRVF